MGDQTGPAQTIPADPAADDKPAVLIIGGLGMITSTAGLKALFRTLC